jgi:WD40 repeat protein
MFEGYPDSITSLIAGQFFLYASGFARDIYQWDVSSGSISSNFEGHTDDVYTLKLNSIFLFSGSRDRTLRVWNAQIPAAIKVFYGKSLSDFNIL